MVGLIARYGGKVVVATAPSRQGAEEIALQLFMEAGYNLKGVQIPLIIFDTEEIGGLILDPSDMATENDEVPSMDNWSVDGYLGPTDPTQSEG